MLTVLHFLTENIPIRCLKLIILDIAIQSPNYNHIIFQFFPHENVWFFFFKLGQVDFGTEIARWSNLGKWKLLQLDNMSIKEMRSDIENFDLWDTKNVKGTTIPFQSTKYSLTRLMKYCIVIFYKSFWNTQCSYYNYLLTTNHLSEHLQTLGHHHHISKDWHSM